MDYITLNKYAQTKAKYIKNRVQSEIQLLLRDYYTAENVVLGKLIENSVPFPLATSTTEKLVSFFVENYVIDSVEVIPLLNGVQLDNGELCDEDDSTVFTITLKLVDTKEFLPPISFNYQINEITYRKMLGSSSNNIFFSKLFAKVGQDISLYKDIGAEKLFSKRTFPNEIEEIELELHKMFYECVYTEELIEYNSRQERENFLEFLYDIKLSSLKYDEESLNLVAKTTDYIEVILSKDDIIDFVIDGYQGYLMQEQRELTDTFTRNLCDKMKQSFVDNMLGNHSLQENAQVANKYNFKQLLVDMFSFELDNGTEIKVSLQWKIPSCSEYRQLTKANGMKLLNSKLVMSYEIEITNVQSPKLPTTIRLNLKNKYLYTVQEDMKKIVTQINSILANS